MKANGIEKIHNVWGLNLNLNVEVLGALTVKAFGFRSSDLKRNILMGRPAFKSTVNFYHYEPG